MINTATRTTAPTIASAIAFPLCANQASSAWPTEGYEGGLFPQSPAGVELGKALLDRCDRPITPLKPRASSFRDGWPFGPRVVGGGSENGHMLPHDPGRDPANFVLEVTVVSPLVMVSLRTNSRRSGLLISRGTSARVERLIRRRNGFLLVRFRAKEAFVSA